MSVPTNAKALLATPDGTLVSQATYPIPLLTPRPGWVETKPRRLVAGGRPGGSARDA